jgi:hypothetical protein
MSYSKKYLRHQDLQLIIVAMVRKNAAAEGSSAPSSVTSTTDKEPCDRAVHNHNKPSNKTKKRRQHDAFRGCIVVLIVVVVVLLALVTMTTRSSNPYAPKYASSKSLRRKIDNSRDLVESSSDGEGGKDYDRVESKIAGQVVEFLPPNSVYKVSMESITGELVDFSKYRGFVSLIVNVACL